MISLEATYVEYQSKIRNLKKYNESLKQPATYIYQIDQRFLQEFFGSYIHRPWQYGQNS